MLPILSDKQALCAKRLPYAFVGCCSRAMAGVLSADVLEARLDENGTDFLTAAMAAGYGAGSTQVGKPCYLLQARVWPCSHDPRRDYQLQL